ncbi:MAG: hypothetical protein O2960_09580 [Verrucomicrobia bacterium]|nr:hypothetical protein [Verrucomicrobiota bacterium]
MRIVIGKERSVTDRELRNAFEPLLGHLDTVVSTRRILQARIAVNRGEITLEIVFCMM